MSDLNTARFAGGGFGIYTSALMAGGDSDPPQRANTEQWDGTSWTEIADLATARGAVAGGGTVTEGFVAGGYSTTYVSITEEWEVPDFQIKTVTTS